MNDVFLIKKPLVTEKATSLNGAGKYVFMVKPSATKNEVKKAIQELYNVKPVRVNMVNRPPKGKRFRGRRGLRSGYRKAIVTLKTGETIDLGK